MIDISGYEQIFQSAVRCENNSQWEQCDRYYRQLLAFERLPLRVLQRMCGYFSGIGELAAVKGFIRQAIEEGGDLAVFGPLFLQSVEDTCRPDDIHWLLQQGADSHLELSFACMEYLERHGMEIYADYISLYERMTKAFIQHGEALAGLYVKGTLLAVRLEWKRKHIAQSRFHLRKLLDLKREHLAEWDEITAWALVLDLLPELFQRRDILSFRERLGNSMSLFLTYYEEAAARSLTVETLEALDRLQVEEPLQDQRILLFLLGKKLEQKDFSPAELAWLRQQPYSWSAVRLYVLDQGLDGLPHLKQSFCHHADLPEAVSYLQQLTQAAAAKEKKDLSPVRITVVGGGEKIGGTSILASVGEHHLLLDAGMHLNDPNRVFPNYQVLHQQGIDFADIDALVVTHAHLDHTGAVPYVHQLHKGLPIYATEETRELMEVLLRDVQRNNRTTPGFYSEQDLQAALHHMQTVSLGSTISIPSKGKEWKVTFYRAGHILGAAAIHLVIDDYSILFTGDYSLDRQRTVSGLQLPPDLSVDVLITESTYGYLPSNAATTREWQEKQLVQLLLDVTEKGGSILIPAFALGRAQELLLIVKEHFKQQRFLPFIVYLDGMVPEICRIYEHYLKDDPLRKENEALFFGGGVQAASQIYRSFSFDEHYDQIMAGGKRVIIASSGMLQEGSASARYAERMLPRPEHALAFTGYIDEESPGYSIHALREQQQRTIALHGKDVDVRARVASFRLSAHASREQIVETVVSLQPQMVLLVHGEHEQSYKPPRAEGRIAVYPTVRQLLGQLPMKVIAAYNGQTYSMISEETQ